MDMKKKITCAVIFAAASMSAVMAASTAPASSPDGATLSSASVGAAPASAPGPDSSVATSTLPVLGSLVGAFIVSFFA
ncbi:hypothetical protein ERO13_A01G135000v2 [Gossypium hirsutum]|uniref:Arabinogalactan peptide 23-like n=2 Tax=Gossypium TaxID=3633 RepID=A0A5J5WXI2_GOSBA|nr:hypothetical protein ES319_A01G138700v1 [Gossypium barbadense]KAG4214673.1 hypothetical protein ERO13_A01G135000v2 [Gossypium hirsutum]TYH31151.1 hypothetical protein ES288_A01G150800v1 [Gossypium darwinii]